MDLVALVSQACQHMGGVSALARAVGVSRQSVINWKRGSCFPRPKVAQKIQTLLGEDPDPVALLVREKASPREIFAAGMRYANERLPCKA
jgi:DNA-binding XRE family transcriptional regulator